MLQHEHSPMLCFTVLPHHCFALLKDTFSSCLHAVKIMQYTANYLALGFHSPCLACFESARHCHSVKGRMPANAVLSLLWEDEGKILMNPAPVT